MCFLSNIINNNTSFSKYTNTLVIACLASMRLLQFSSQSQCPASFQERSSKSLLANVLDIDDDFRAHTLPHPGHTNNSTPGGGIIRIPHSGHSVDDSHLVHTCMSQCTRELNLILKEIKVITDKMRKEDEESEVIRNSMSTNLSIPHLHIEYNSHSLDIFSEPTQNSEAGVSHQVFRRFYAYIIFEYCRYLFSDYCGDFVQTTNDWRFAAMVVDRMCLIVFTLFTVTATVAVLMSAPHIMVP